MDTNIIEVRQNIIITAALNNASSFSFLINKVNFIPDEVIVRGINYHPTAPETGITMLYTDLVSDVIGSFFQDFYIKPDLTFTLRKRIFGLFNFQIIDYSGAITARTGRIFIHLEFLKYANSTPNVKIY